MHHWQVLVFIIGYRPFSKPLAMVVGTKRLYLSHQTQKALATTSIFRDEVKPRKDKAMQLQSNYLRSEL